MSEEKIFKELEEEAQKLYASMEAGMIPGVQTPMEAELEQASVEVYGKEPELVQVLGISAAQSGTATHALVDYVFTSAVRRLWAYVGGRWRGRNINEAQVGGIAKVVMEADRLDVWWSNNTINFVRCWKKY